MGITFQGKGIVVTSYLGATYTAVAPNGAGRGFVFNTNEIFTSILNGKAIFPPAVSDDAGHEQTHAQN